MKKIIILTILMILIIPFNIKAYELETEGGEYEYSKTIPESGYSYSHTICNGIEIKNEDVTYNEETKTFEVKGVTEQSSCKFYFNKNGEEIIKNYEVKATVLNGTIEGDTTKIVKQNTNATFTFNPSSGYGSPTVSCTNSQTGTMNGNTLTVNNVTNDTTCTVEYKMMTGIASDVIISKATEGNGEGLITLNQPATGQTPAQTEYRYSGSNDTVKNYVNFNDETWRIIGVFPTDDGTGKIENRVKIIREESIGDYPWDTSDFTINYSYGINQWGSSGSYEGADLMRLLNPGYESESINNSLYWNRESGICHNNFGNGTTDCDFSSTGLTSDAKGMIEDAVWYTSVSDYVNTASESYADERSSKTKDSSNEDGVTRTTNWTGIVGLLYPSDYGYASSECRNGEQVLDDYDNETCTSTNWLYNSDNQWLLSPSTGYSFFVHNVYSTGGVGNSGASGADGIRPVTFLSSSVKITGGSGTSSNPYELSL